MYNQYWSRKLKICWNCDELQFHYRKSPYCKECNRENKKYFHFRSTIKMCKNCNLQKFHHKWVKFCKECNKRNK